MNTKAINQVAPQIAKPKYLRIHFPFEVEQMDAYSVEIKPGGLGIPELSVSPDDASKWDSRTGLTEAEHMEVLAKAQAFYTRKIIIASIKVEGAE